MSILFTNIRVTHLRFIDAFQWIQNTAENQDSTGTISIYAGIVLEYHTLSRCYALMFVD
jgi:hypothetical protein